MKTYNAYRFRSKDPAIDVARTLIEDVTGKRINGAALKKIEEDGGPSATCMRAWFFGKTMRPQNPTMEAMGRALGYHRPWVKMK